MNVRMHGPARTNHRAAAGWIGAAAAIALGAGGYMWWRRHRGVTTTRLVQEFIDIEVPVSTAYNQWTQFEEFPRFMPAVENVKQLDDSHLHWRAKVAGRVREWDSEITQQVPDQLIAWRSTDGPGNSGTVTFDKIGENRTRVKLQIWYEPETTGEKVGSALGAVKFTAKGNLRRFKHLVETRGAETGAWRGEVQPTH